MVRTPIEYKPGCENIIADALSRAGNPTDCINTSSLQSTEHSMESSPTEPITKTSKPVNDFRNQLHIFQSNKNESFSSTIFPNYHVHTIKYTSIKNLLACLTHLISNRNINAMHTTERTFFGIKNPIKEKFPNVKFVFSQNSVTNKDEQIDIVQSTHTRAHRNYKNNILEISEKYFWPQVRAERYAIGCEICLMEKYERHPEKETLKPTPIPTKPSHSIHLDIFYLENRLFLSTADRFSKYFYLREIPNKRNMSSVVEEILAQIYPECIEVMTDNDAIFTSQTIRSLFRQKNISFVNTPVGHSTTNGQVERIHSTILEMANSLARQNSCDTVDEIFNAVKQYNCTMVFFNLSNIDFNIVKNNIQQFHRVKN